MNFAGGVMLIKVDWNYIKVHIKEVILMSLQ